MELKKVSKPKNYFWYYFVKITGAIPLYLYLRTKVIRVGNATTRPKGAVMITANHFSFLDPAVIHSAFPWRVVHSLATKDLYNTNFKNWFFTKTHCIQVDKQNFSMNSFHETCDLLKRQKAVLIFPEGKINNQEEMLGFKSGAVLMAHRSNAPIIPVYLVKPTKKHARRVVVVGEPIDIKQIVGPVPTMDDLQRASDVLREKELELIDFYNKRKGEKR